VTLALRVLAAPDHVPGSVVPLSGTHPVGAVVEQGGSRCMVVDVLCVFEARFSSGQIVIVDDDAELAGQWTERHLAQGFIRGAGHVGLRTLPGEGELLVRAFSSPYAPLAEDARVIAVPLRVTSGRVRVGEQLVEVVPGEYRLVTCQRFFDGEQDLDLFFERVDLPRQRSEILVADRELSPERPLLETDRS
jgi:hypothetical protein